MFLLFDLAKPEQNSASSLSKLTMIVAGIHNQTKIKHELISANESMPSSVNSGSAMS